MKQLLLILTFFFSFIGKGQTLKSQATLRWEHIAGFFFNGRNTVMNHLDEATLQQKLTVYKDSLLKEPLSLTQYKFMRMGKEVPAEINVLNADDTLIRHGILFPVSIRIINDSVWESVLKPDNSLKVYYRLADVWRFFTAEDSIMLNYMLHTGETFIDRNAMDVIGEREHKYLATKLYMLAERNKIPVYCGDSLEVQCIWSSILANCATEYVVQYNSSSDPDPFYVIDSFFSFPCIVDSVRGIKLLLETSAKGLAVNSQLLAIGPACNTQKYGIDFLNRVMFWAKPKDFEPYFEKARMDLYLQVFAIAVNEKFKN